MRVVVTGGAGFIGSHVVDALLARGDEVVVVDNFTTGDESNLTNARTSSDKLTIEHCDIATQAERLTEVFTGATAVVHLAANADVRFGWEAPRRDLEQNVIATHNVLEAMRAVGAKRLLFSSTGSVYGESAVIPTPEDAPFPVQTSLYGASKLSAEGYIAAYAENRDVSATVFRFVSILGPRYSHGHVIDFFRQLEHDPSHLTVLGDGTQRKSYLDVTDCVSALMSRLDEEPGYEVFNLGVDESCTVTDSVGWICQRLRVEPTIEYSGGNRGWVGDNPFILLDTGRMRATGWQPTYSIREAVERTVDALVSDRSLPSP